jgi:hypothetical protein
LKIIATSSTGNTISRSGPYVPLRADTPVAPVTAGRITLSGRFSFMSLRHILPVLVVSAAVSTAAAYAGDWSLIGRGVMTTNSLLYPRTNASNDADRVVSIELSSSFGAGGEIRYTMPDRHLAVGLSIDGVSASTSATLKVGSVLDIPMVQGIKALAAELTGYFIIPLSGEAFSVYMGGGVGAYVGQRTYRIGGVESESSPMKPGIGIHVLTGVNYRLFGHIDVSFDVKFRDLQFEAENSFPVPTMRFNGYVYALPPGTIRSRTQTDGIVLQVGAGFTL